MTSRRSSIVLAALAATALLAATTSSAFAVNSLVTVDTRVTDLAPGGDGDGALEPGETADLTHRLYNAGLAPATGVSGTLQSISYWLNAAPAPHASWPDVYSGSVEAGTPWSVGLQTSTPCGEQLNMSLDLASDQGADTLPVKLVAGAGPETVSADPHLPRRFTSSSPYVSPVEITESGTVKNLRIRIGDLAHPRLGDVGMSLTSPDGNTTVTLMDGPGAGRWGTDSDALHDVVIADDADTPIEMLSNSPRQSISGTFRPDQPLAAFDGKDKEGTWTLRVWDKYQYKDDGLLLSWGLTPVGVHCATTANDAPVARHDEYAALDGEPLHGASVLLNDSDEDSAGPLTASLYSSPTHGTVDLADNGTFTYTATAGYAGTDSFRYRASDGSRYSRFVTATVTVTGPNYPPFVPSNAGFSTVEGTILRGSLADIVTDRNGDYLTFAVTDSTVPGDLGLQSDGSFEYATPLTDGLNTSHIDYLVYDVDVAHPLAGRVYFSVIGFNRGSPGLILPPSTPKKTSAGTESRAFASFRIQRATMSGAKLKVRATVSKLATGTVKASFRSAGRTTKLATKIAAGKVGFNLPLSARQRRSGAGVLKLSYAGNAVARPERVTFNAARRGPGLRAKRALIDAKGILRVAGSVGRSVRGVVRVHLTYSPRPGVTKVYDYRAKIRSGTWSVTDPLPAEAIRTRGQITMRYEGDRRRGIGAGHLSQDVGG